MNGNKTKKTRRQQLGLPDRWRLLEKLDPIRLVVLHSKYGEREYCNYIVVRQSHIEELKEEYGEDMEVI